MTNRAIGLVFFCMFVLFCLHQPLFAGPSLSQLFTDDVLFTEQTVVFEKEWGGAASTSISSLHLHYLRSNDCQSGYAGLYDTHHGGSVFPISQGKPFGLMASSVYEAGVATLGASKIEDIHSILIRLLSGERQFALFSGLCNDQDVDCCVPVQCSNQTGTCLAQYDFGPQLFTWVSDRG